MKMPKYGWPAAFLLLGLAVITEIIPLVGGRGAEARFDWSFIYVTLHFVLLPLAAVVHLIWNLAALVLSRRQRLSHRLLSAGSVVVSVSYLVLLFFRPVFPFWANELWQSYGARLPWAG
jgi:hypothetical protein